MSARAWLAWSLAGLSVAMFVAGVALALLALSVAGAETSAGVRSVASSLGFAVFLSFPVVGALVASRRPENPIGWICLVAGLFWMNISMGEGWNAYELARTGTVTTSVTLDALSFWIWVVPVGLLGIYMILLFPDGRLPSRRWRPFAWFAGAVMALICVGFVFVPGPVEGHPGVRNPFGVGWLAWMADLRVLIVLMLPLCILASAWSLVLRFRRSRGEVREQIKWLAFAVSVVGVVYFGSLLAQILLVPESLDANAASAPLWVDILNNLLLTSYAGVPVAVGIAILRYRLYDIEIVINRALVYGPLTATLVTIYAASVVSLQYAFRALSGQTSQLVVVASTLAIAALFNPLEATHPGCGRSALLPPQVRRGEDARSLLDEAS